MMLKVLDLFSGIGGFSLGLERTGGFEAVAFCEIDPFCRRVLAKHWPDVRCSEDITKREFLEGEADVITAGFPCQDISYAGKRAGMSGSRSGLFWEMVRAVRVVRPLYVIVENVAALSTGGLGDVLGAMAVLRYDGEWDCVPASSVGAPHGRPRIWFAFTDPDRKQRAVGVGQSLRWRQRVAQETAQASPDAHGSRQLQSVGMFGNVRRWLADGVARGFWACDWQAKFEALRRMDDGVPSRLDRRRDSAAIGALGNSVIHQIPELIGNAILAARAA